MKPIEIHIEGYKIVISEDDKKENITYQPKRNEEVQDLPKSVPYNPPDNTGDWWKNPYVTWTSDDTLHINTTSTDFHPIRDKMTGCKCK